MSSKVDFVRSEWWESPRGVCRVRLCCQEAPGFFLFVCLFGAVLLRGLRCQGPQVCLFVFGPKEENQGVSDGLTGVFSEKKDLFCSGEVVLDYVVCTSWSYHTEATYLCNICSRCIGWKNIFRF